MLDKRQAESHQPIRKYVFLLCQRVRETTIEPATDSDIDTETQPHSTDVTLKYHIQVGANNWLQTLPSI